MLNFIYQNHFTCVEDSGFPEVHHTAQFSWSSSPCTVVLGERELPWTAQPWRDGHGDCQQQVSVLSSLTLTCHGDCQQQVSVLSSETVTLKRCSRRLASRWVFVLSSVILNNHGDLASRSVFVLSSVTLNSHANKPADESVLNSETFNKWLWKLYRKPLNNPPDQESFFCL